MKFYSILIIFAIVVFAYKLLLNIYRLYKINALKKHYEKWVENLYKQENLKNINLYKAEAIELFKEAGIDIKNKFIPIVQTTNSGIFQAKVNLVENFGLYNADIIGSMRNLFAEALGIFKKRAKETFSPFYWINILIFLPREILVYIGLNSEAVLVKISNMIYWLLITLYSINIIISSQILHFQILISPK